jgi:hypothetical protein
MAPQFRWNSGVLAGRWRRTRDEALSDAVGHGQASVSGDATETITLNPYVSIEQHDVGPDVGKGDILGTGDKL